MKVNETMNKEKLFEKLTPDLKENIQNILDNESVPGVTELRVLIKNVKEWPYISAINRLNNEPVKTPEILEKIIDYKKRITTIRKSKD